MSDGDTAYHFYVYNPSLVWNSLFTAVMGLALLTHIAQMFYFRNSYWFSVCFILGIICELIGYIARLVSHNNVTNMSIYVCQATTLVFAPVFIMAGIYYLLAQMIVVYGRKYSLISARLCSYAFVIGDVLSLFLQGAGGGLMAGSDGASYNTGQALIITGLACQVLLMTIFLFLVGVFLHRIRFLKSDHFCLDYNPKYETLRKRLVFRWYPVVIIASVLFIYVRSVYRLAEFIEPRSGNLQSKEGYFLVLDALMMNVAIWLLTIFHPGYVIGKVVIAKARSRTNSNDYVDYGAGQCVPQSGKDYNGQYELNKYRIIIQLT